MGASKAKPEILREFLSVIASRPNIANACRVVGISETVIHSYIRRSRQGDPALIFSWPENEPPDQFCNHLVYARRISLINFESQVRDEIMHGTPRILRNAATGQIVYEQDERFIGCDDDTMKLLGLDEPSIEYHRTKRDEKGMPIPAVVYDQAPAHLKIKVMTSAIPGYQEHKTVDINQKINGSVMHIPAAGQTKQPELIEHIVEHDDRGGDLLTPEPPEMVTEPEETNRPDIIELRRLASMSPEERRAEFRAAKAPSSATIPYRPMEDRSEGLGTGHVIPGGAKVR